MIKGKELAESEVSKLTWIFSEFFNFRGKGDTAAAMAEAIIKDQIETLQDEENPEPLDQYYLSVQFKYEICLLFEELNTVADYERLRLKNLGIDANFLHAELPSAEAEEVIEKYEAYDEILERQEADWYQRMMYVFEDII